MLLADGKALPSGHRLLIDSERLVYEIKTEKHTLRNQHKRAVRSRQRIKQETLYSEVYGFSACGRFTCVFLKTTQTGLLAKKSVGEGLIASFSAANHFRNTVFLQKLNDNGFISVEKRKK